jgi:zinc transport system permease protein
LIQHWYSLIEKLPFEWANYAFMANALLGVILITPLFGLLGTMTVSNRLAFFSDSLGHSALTGIAIGVLMGFENPIWSTIIFSVLFAAIIVLVKNIYHGPTDTVIGVFASMAVALGIVILSRDGGFSKYTRYLIGDLLAISADEIRALLFLLIAVFVIWLFIFNKLLVSSINSALARSRGIKTLMTELIFTSLIAIIVAVSLRWVGLLIINSLLIIPAATARVISTNIRMYHLLSVLIALFSGLAGLLLSFYWDTATGATIVLVASAIFIIALFMKRRHN